MKTKQTAKNDDPSIVHNPNLFYRAATIRAEDVTDARRIEFTFSSEAAVERWFGKEILSHRPENVRLERINEMGAMLFNHNPNVIVGPIIKAVIGDDKRGHAVGEFDKDAIADGIYEKVKSRSLRGISVGYLVHKYLILEDPSDEYDGYRGPAYIATDWEPIETSFTPIPADSQVGVGRDYTRSLDGIKIERIEPERKEKQMDFEKLAALLAEKGLTVQTEDEVLAALAKLEVHKEEKKAETPPPAPPVPSRTDVELDIRNRYGKVFEKAAAAGLSDLAARLFGDGKAPEDIDKVLWDETLKLRSKPVGEAGAQAAAKVELSDDELVQGVTNPSLAID